MAFRNKPNGAYKLLVHILYGQYTFITYKPRQVIELQGIRRLGRLLGTRSSTIRDWFQWLEDQGYIESLQYSEDRRSATFRVRVPSSSIIG